MLISTGYNSRMPTSSFTYTILSSSYGWFLSVCLHIWYVMPYSHNGKYQNPLSPDLGGLLSYSNPNFINHFLHLFFFKLLRHFLQEQYRFLNHYRDIVRKTFACLPPPVFLGLFFEALKIAFL